MRLADALDLPWEENFEPESKAAAGLYDRMVEGFMDFLRAGGGVYLEDWAGFTPLEREAAARAGDRICAIRSSLVGLASQGAHAEVLSVDDGGDAMIASALERALDSLEGQA